jgi:hypothetical protein
MKPRVRVERGIESKVEEQLQTSITISQPVRVLQLLIARV